MKIEIDGKEIDLQGLEGDSIVIMRPAQELTPEMFEGFAQSTAQLRGVFALHKMSLIVANHNSCTFEVLKAKAQAQDAA